MSGSVKSAGEILANEIGSAVEGLRSCVTPIFDVNDSGEAELLGSAVLIELIGDIFLVTAKHVIDGNTDSTLYIDGHSQLEILEGDFFTSVEHDVAVMKLSCEQVRSLQKYHPVNTDKIATLEHTSACQYISFVGFPATKNRKVFKQNTIGGLVYSLSGIVIEITQTRVRVKFDQKRNIDSKTRNRVTAPTPYGMSGGAMFGVRVDENIINGTPNPMLVGISSHWRKKDKEVFGTNINVVMAVIRDAYGFDLPRRLARTGIAEYVTPSPSSKPEGTQ